MRTTLRLTLLALSLSLIGCATKPKEETTGHVPYKDRPEAAKDYWSRRDNQDRIETKPNTSNQAEHVRS